MERRVFAQRTTGCEGGVGEGPHGLMRRSHATRVKACVDEVAQKAVLFPMRNGGAAQAQRQCPFPAECREFRAIPQKCLRGLNRVLPIRRADDVAQVGHGLGLHAKRYGIPREVAKGDHGALCIGIAAVAGERFKIGGFRKLELVLLRKKLAQTAGHTGNQQPIAPATRERKTFDEGLARIRQAVDRDARDAQPVERFRQRRRVAAGARDRDTGLRERERLLIAPRQVCDFRRSVQRAAARNGFLLRVRVRDENRALQMLADPGRVAGAEA